MLRGSQLVPLVFKSRPICACAVMELLFSEELGLVLEVSQVHVETVRQRYCDAGVECRPIGRTCNFGPEAQVRPRARRMSPALFKPVWH